MPPKKIYHKNWRQYWRHNRNPVNGHKISYDVDLYATVANLKQKIGNRIGSDVIDDQFIIFAGKRLSDHKRLIDYNIQIKCIKLCF
jgi:hypothetical protein